MLILVLAILCSYWPIILTNASMDDWNSKFKYKFLYLHHQMKSSRATYSLALVLILLVVFIYRRWQEPLRKEAFDRTPSHIYYTKHALCRMDCRKISKDDIDEIMKKGIINFNRSNRRGKPCPTFALQGETSDGEKLRVIFAQCTDETKVVSCYNLEEDFECHCPGDPPGNSVQAPNRN